jgi:hypothetical protein
VHPIPRTFLYETEAGNLREEVPRLLETHATFFMVCEIDTRDSVQNVGIMPHKYLH